MANNLGKYIKLFYPKYTNSQNAHFTHNYLQNTLLTQIFCLIAIAHL